VSHATGLEFANNAMSLNIYHQTPVYNAHITAVFALMLLSAITTAQRTMPSMPLLDNAYQWELKEWLWDYWHSSVLSSISCEL